MSDLIRREEDVPTPVSISKTELAPIESTDSRSVWGKFVDFVRQNIGLKPLYLAERFGEAEVRKREADAASAEVDNEIKLLKAKQEYEQVQAEIRRQDLLANGEAAKAEAEVEALKANTRDAKARARIQEAAAREIERRKQSPEKAMQRLQMIVDKIRDSGGDVEIPPLDGEFDELDEQP